MDLNLLFWVFNLFSYVAPRLKKDPPDLKTDCLSKVPEYIGCLFIGIMKNVVIMIYS